MNTLIKVLATSVFVLGVQQVAVAETCVEAWKQSSASKSCGSGHSPGNREEVTDLGNGQCRVITYCSTNASKNSLGNSVTHTLQDTKRLENQSGNLRFK